MKYVVAEGFIVAGKSAGEVVESSEVDRVDILVESGRLVPVRAGSSAKMKGANVDVPKEDDHIG